MARDADKGHVKGDKPLPPLPIMAVLPLILVYILLPEARLRPASAPIVYDKGLEDYLTQFGYLPSSNGESMRTHLQVENALKNLQF